MSPPGRPKGEYRNVQHEGCLISAPRPPHGRRPPKGISANIK